jgi:hypothetical protein
MVDQTKIERPVQGGAEQGRPQRLPWTPPRLETAEVSLDTAATLSHVVQESPNSIS